MTFQSSSCCGGEPPLPVAMPPLRAGEIDGRYIDVSADLGVVGDCITDIDTVEIAISRGDGATMTANDLHLAGTDWPNSLDLTGQVITVGFEAPAGSAGQAYWITLTVSLTLQGRLYIRDMTMVIPAVMG